VLDQILVLKFDKDLKEKDPTEFRQKYLTCVKNRLC